MKTSYKAMLVTLAVPAILFLAYAGSPQSTRGSAGMNGNRIDDTAPIVPHQVRPLAQATQNTRPAPTDNNSEGTPGVSTYWRNLSQIERFQELTQCVSNKGGSLDLQIDSCTKVIQSGSAAKNILVSAFNARGFAYFSKGQYDLAIQDFDQAIRIDPNFAKAFNNRGLAKQKKGDMAGAAVDMAKATEASSVQSTTVKWCLIQVDGKTYLNSNCNVGNFDHAVRAGGSFSINTESDGGRTSPGYFAYVYLNGTTAKAVWNADAKHIQPIRLAPLGELTKSGDCWINARTKICVTRAQQQFQPVGFKTPSSNIYCQFTDVKPSSYVRCDMEISFGVTPKPSQCDFGAKWDNRAFYISDDGDIGKPVCRTDTLHDDRLEILSYGSVWQHRGFTCKSETNGLTCINASGHGFVLTKELQKLF